MGVLGSVLKGTIVTVVALLFIWGLAVLVGGVFTAVWDIFEGIYNQIFGWITNVGADFGFVEDGSGSWWEDAVTNWNDFWDQWLKKPKI